jgi:hypothetical protein
MTKTRKTQRKKMEINIDAHRFIEHAIPGTNSPADRRTT